MKKNTEYFPKTSEVFEDSKKMGVKDYKKVNQINNLSQYLNQVFSSEYQTYVKNEEYFPGCPLKIYRKSYHDRFEEYKLIYPDADEFDFLKKEDAIIHNLFEMDRDNKENFYPFYPYLFPDPHWKNLKLSVDKIRNNFIDKRIIELDHYFYVTGVDPVDYEIVPRQHFELMRNPDARDMEKPQFFQYCKPSLEKKSNPKKNEIKALKWSSADYSDLNHIHKKLKEHGYLNCDLVLFKRLFLGNKDFDKIIWLKADSSLIYFYGRLIDKSKIKKPSNKWVKFKEVFEYSGSSASSLYSQYKNEIKNLPDKSFFDSLIK